MIRLLVIAVTLLLVATPVSAGPVFFAVLAAGGGLGAAFGATALGTFLATTVGRLLVTVAVSALQAALAPKPKKPGIVTDQTQTGGTNPVCFILGRYATAGTAVCPAMSHGETRGRLTYVISVGDLPRHQLLRVMIDDEYAPINWGSPDHPEGYGKSIGGRFQDWAFVKFYDGTQTAADPGLLAQYSAYPKRPWSANMIGRGVSYAILMFRLEEGVFQGLPSVTFEVQGIPLYDPRKDTSVGGDGTQRWYDPASWATSDNPAVMCYNIARGISFPDGTIYGGRWPVEALPLDVWFAAMNICDEPVTMEIGGTEPRFRAGYEVKGTDEPASIIEELLRGCGGEMAEVGGQLLIRIGPPTLPVYFFTDDDVVISRDQEDEPFPGLDDIYNGIHASYPEPESSWNPKDAPARYNATWEAEDNDRRLIAELNLPAVPYAMQVQRVMKAYIEEERRFRRHTVSLPPDAAILSPLDSVSWTSARNGYTAKTFEVAQVVDELTTMIQTVVLREKDAGDFDWSPADELPSEVIPVEPSVPDPLAVPGFEVTVGDITDGNNIRRPSIRMSWTPDELQGVYGLMWRIRRAGDTLFLSGTTQDVLGGSLTVTAGILSDTDYEVSARLVVDVAAAWTDWVAVTTDAILLGTGDVDWEQLDGQLDADWIQTGKLSAEFFRVNKLLTIEKNAGLSYGKATPQDAADGIYFGVTSVAGVPAFGLAASRTNAGKRQSVRITPDGFRISNARHTVTGTSLPASVTATSSVAKTFLPAGTKEIIVSAIVGSGGGGASGGDSTGAVNPGTDGQDTILKLYDGATLMHTFTAEGGVGGTTYRGDVSTRAGQTAGVGALGAPGSGGAANAQHSYEGTSGSQGNPVTKFHSIGGPAAAGTGYGVGGSAGGSTLNYGGLAGTGGEVLVPGAIDVSGWAAPAYEITMGPPGSGGARTVQNACSHSGYGRGGAGADGRPAVVTFSHSASLEIPADVVPLKPTATGTFSKGNNVAGSFPALGAGLWVIDTGVARTALNLSAVVIDAGVTIELFNANSATFFAAQTPTFPAAANARTISYKFYSMGSWG